jgi:hypothetical protein
LRVAPEALSGDWLSHSAANPEWYAGTKDAALHAWWNECAKLDEAEQRLKAQLAR